MKTVTLVSLHLAFVFGFAPVAFSCEPPQIVSIACNAGNVMIQFETEVSPSIQGFNFYCDDEFVEFMPYTGDSVYNHFLVYQSPGDHVYCITTLCTVAIYKMPAETIESDPDCEAVGCYYGFDLPFDEDWEPGFFSLNDWEISSADWIISEDTGNNPPAALFEPTGLLNDYSESLESYYLNAYGMTEGHIYLEFDISLSSFEDSGTEHLLVQVWDHQSESYSTVKDFTNQEGSFGWIRDTIDIRPYSMGKVFRIRFLAQGENTSYIDYWGIDNIRIYRECYPLGITLDSYLLNDTCIVLETNDNDLRNLEILLYVYRDNVLIDIYSEYFPMPDPYCVSEPGEYCFMMVGIWESETDQCLSYSEPACEQVIINSFKEENTREEISYRIDEGFLRIQSSAAIDQLDIYDLSGRKIISASPGSTSYNQNLSHFKSGLYIIRSNSSDNIFIKKLIIR